MLECVICSWLDQCIYLFVKRLSVCLCICLSLFSDSALYRPQESSEPLLDLAIIIGCSDDVIRLRALFEQYTSEESWELWSEVKWLLADL